MTDQVLWKRHAKPTCFGNPNCYTSDPGPYKLRRVRPDEATHMLTAVRLDDGRVGLTAELIKRTG